MRAGRSVLCEKPIAMTVADAEAMIRCRDETGATLGIGFCKRHLPQLAKLRELVQEGAIGRPVMYRMVAGTEIRFKPWIMDAAWGADRSSTCVVTTSISGDGSSTPSPYA